MLHHLESVLESFLESLLVTFTEQNATMDDPFLVNTSCRGLLSISSVSDLQEPPKTTSHFGKFTFC